MLKRFLQILVLGVLCHSSVALAAPEKELWSLWDKSNEQSAQQINHDLWANILQQYLRIDHPSAVNRFDYQAFVQADDERLDDYLQQLQAIDPRQYNRNEQFAYWVNLYNALTIKVIIEEYPVASIVKTGERLFSFGPWDDEVATVAGEELTLNDIEHRILRPIWNDLRIHFAVNCASIGCPQLLTEPFLAETLDQQLDQAARDFMTHARAVEFKNDQLVLSKIFEWYQVDFGDSEQQMLNTISNFLPAAKAERVKNFQGKIRYQYNWDLNEP